MGWVEDIGQGLSDFFMGTKAVAPEQRQVDYGQANESRAYMMPMLADLQRQYAAMASGQGPSLAQGQLQQATDANISQAMALGAAQQGQGLGYSSALRNIADQSAAARQQAAAQSALIRNQEQMQAMQGLGNVASMYGGVRGQDLGQAGLQQQGNIAYDTMKYNASAANANHGVLPSLINAGGAVLGSFLGRGGGGGGDSSAQGLAAGGGSPVLDGGLRAGYGSSGMGDFGYQPGPMYGATGGMVPGYAHGGDSLSNDTVPSMLSPGEIVLPRSITMAPDAGERARLFVEAVQKRRAAGPPSTTHHMVRDAESQRKRKAA